MHMKPALTLEQLALVCSDDIYIYMCAQAYFTAAGHYSWLHFISLHFMVHSEASCT